MGYLVVIIDVVSMLVIIIFLICSDVYLNKKNDRYKSEYTLISNFTLCLKDIELESHEVQDYIRRLKLHLEMLFSFYSSNIGRYIPKIPDLTIENVKISLNNDKNKRVILNDVNYAEYNDDIVDALKSDSQNKEINFSEKVTEIFFTFRTQGLANFYFKTFNLSKFKRFLMILFCNGKKIEHLYFENNWLNFEITADQPTNINYLNLSYPGWKRGLRTIFIYLISLIFIVASFAIILGGNSAEKLLGEEFNINTKCFDKIQENTISLEIQNNQYLKSSNVYCFCTDLFNTQGYSITKNYKINNVEVCKTWLSSYIKYISLYYGIIVLIPILNLIIMELLIYLTRFEKNKKLSSDATSKFFKITILQIINSGVIILLVNSRFESIKKNVNWLPIFTGSFNDFDPQWFLVVGSSIVRIFLIDIFHDNKHSTATFIVNIF